MLAWSPGLNPDEGIPDTVLTLKFLTARRLLEKGVSMDNLLFFRFESRFLRLLPRSYSMALSCRCLTLSVQSKRGGKLRYSVFTVTRIDKKSTENGASEKLACSSVDKSSEVQIGIWVNREAKDHEGLKS